MDSAQAQRRLQAINGHLISDVAESESILRPNSTAAEFVSGPLPLSYLSALFCLCSISFLYMKKIGIVFLVMDVDFGSSGGFVGFVLKVL